MKAESTVMPVAPYEIEYDGEWAVITFFENVVPVAVEEDEAQKWEYDEYRLRIKNRDNLIATLDSHYADWVDFAKASENVVPEETDREKIARLEKEKAELDGVIGDMVQVLVDKGVIW